MEKLALAAFDQGDLELADVRSSLSFCILNLQYIYYD